MSDPDPKEPAAIPAAEPAAIPAAEPTAAAEPAAVPAAEPAAPAVDAHTDTASFLTRTEEKPTAEAPAEAKPGEEAKPAEPAKPGEEAKPAEEAKPGEVKSGDEAKPAEDVKPAPLVYDAPPTLPEGVSLNPERIAAFDQLIGAAQVPPETRQGLVDMFVAERGQWEKETLAEQHRQFAVTRKGWRDRIFADEELGGGGTDTTQAAAMRMIDLFVAPQHRGEWEEFLLTTGGGDHPALTRFLKNLDKKFGAAPTPTVPNNPAPDRGGANGRGKRMRDMYDNPRSQTS